MRTRFLKLLFAALTFLAAAMPASARAGERQDAAHRRIEYLERFYRHFAAGRAIPISEMLPDAMTWSHTGYRPDIVPFAGDYTGRERIREFFESYFAAVTIRDYQFQYKLSDGDYVTWHFKLVAVVPMTGKTFDAEFIDVWRFDAGGAPVQCRRYYDTQVEIASFTLGGPALVADRRDPADDYRVQSTPYDVESMVRTVYDNFYAGNIGAALALVADDAAIYFKGESFPFAGTYIGKGEILNFVYNLAGTALPQDISRFQVTEGDRTDVVLFENWLVYSTGKAFHCHTVNSWRVNGAGLLTGFSNTPDTDEVAQAYVP